VVEREWQSHWYLAKDGRVRRFIAEDGEFFSLCYSVSSDSLMPIHPVISLSTELFCSADPTEKTTLSFIQETRGVFRIDSLIGTGYSPKRHPLATVPHAILRGSYPISVTGRPEICTSLSSPQTSSTSSDVRVRVWLSSPVEGSAVTMKHGSLVNSPLSLSKKRVKTSRYPGAFQEANLHASSSPFKSRVVSSRYMLSRSDFQFARFTAISVGVR
jgi:hypothetical protein